MTGRINDYNNIIIVKIVFFDFSFNLEGLYPPHPGIHFIGIILLNFLIWL